MGYNMNDDQNVYFVEDYSFENKEIKLFVFDIKSFYDEMLRIIGGEDFFIKSPRDISLDRYAEAYHSIDESVFFQELTIPYECNANFYENAFCEKFYSIDNNVLKPIVDNQSAVKELYIAWKRGSLDISKVNRYVLKTIIDFNFYFHNTETDYRNVNIQLKNRVYAAVVNVGFGNCCFIFDNNFTIAVDCSNQDKKGGHFQGNIDSAIDWIRKIQKRKRFHIDVFLLSHPHFDHYSGVCRMIENNYIDRYTKFFINRVYRREIPSYTKVLAYLKEAGIKCTHSVVCNGIGGFEILHPVHSHKVYNKPNNSSVIVSVSVGNGKFAIPGDIENVTRDMGWNEVPDSVKTEIAKAEYYMLSHHGSQNGLCGQALPQKPILTFCSTRPGVYSGVPDSSTLNNFANLHRTDIGSNLKYIRVFFFLKKARPKY